MVARSGGPLAALDELFPRGIPRDFQAIFRDPERDGSTPGIDLAETMNRLDRDNSVKATLAELRRLVRVAEDTGDRMDRLLAECIGEWLVLKEWITKEQKREAKTMAQVMTAWERSLEEFGSRRERKGHAAGERKAHAAVLCRLADREVRGVGSPAAGRSARDAPRLRAARHRGGGNP